MTDKIRGLTTDFIIIDELRENNEEKCDLWEKMGKYIEYNERPAYQDFFAQVWDHQQVEIDKLKQENKELKAMFKDSILNIIFASENNGY